MLNRTRALDFMTDSLYGGRRFRALTVIDEGNREALAIEIGTSIPSLRVIRVLEELVALHGRPAVIRVDNGPELTAEAFAEWWREREIAIRYLRPIRTLDRGLQHRAAPRQHRPGAAAHDSAKAHSAPGGTHPACPP